MKPRTSTSPCRPWETSSLPWLKERSVTLLRLFSNRSFGLNLPLKLLVKSVEIHLFTMFWSSVGFGVLISTVSKSEVSGEIIVSYLRLP